MNKTCFRFVMCAAAVAVAAVAPAFEGNVLLNGSLTADQTDVPSWWSLSGEKDRVVLESSGGPNGAPAVRFRGGKGGITLRQYGLSVATNGRYKVSCWVKANGFAPEGDGHNLLIHNKGWASSWGLAFPAGTYGWKRVEREIRIRPSATYGAALHLQAFAGEVLVADLSIAAADAETAAETRESAFVSGAKELRLIPRRPLLSAVPEETREVGFLLSGELKDGTADDYRIVLEDADGRRELPCVLGNFKLKVRSAPDVGTFDLSVVKKADGAVAHKRHFTYRTVKTPAATGGRRLNTLVTELVRERIAADASATYAFELGSVSWVFASADAAKVEIDGKAVIGPETPRHETFRLLEAGRHELAVSGAKGGEVIVRKIPELFDYCPTASVVPEGPSFDWAFQERHVLPAVTVMNGGKIPDDRVEGFRRRGYRWLANMNSRNLTEPDDLVRRLCATPGMTEARYDGVTCDEQFYHEPNMIARFASGLWGLKDIPGRSVYTWIVGRAAGSAIDLDFMSATVNASRGTGKLLTEIYLVTCADEEEARGHIRERAVGAVTDIRTHMPWAIGNYGVILGNYTQFPRISLAVHPEVDYRYYLDMQFNLIANDPAFEGMGCTGVWGSYYADAELHRWTFLLMRHYFVEGNREMLSPKYGFTYIPGHLVNGDFNEGLSGWTAAGDVKAVEKKGLGKAESRWGKASLGDTYAEFTRGKDSVSSLRQTVKGLTPGKRYMLGFMSFDAKMPDRAKAKGRRFGLTAGFRSGAEMVPELCWEHIDRLGPRKRGKRGPFATKVNYQYYVFTATAETAELEITDAEVKPGKGVGVNGISVRPYLEEAACGRCERTGAVRLVSPRQDEVVELVPGEFRDFLSKPRETRRKIFADRDARMKMRETFPPNRPKSVTFAWTGATGGELTVERKADGKTFFSSAIPSNTYALSNFEIARDYVWRVKTADGRVAEGRFRTGDFAPRIIDLPGVPNVRDLGGRIGLGGRRVKQGRIFRSAGLNDNANVNYRQEEVLDLYKKGTLLASVPEKSREAAERIKKYLDDGKPSKADLKHLVKKWCAGAVRMTPETVAWANAFFGFRTDLDLRTDRECYLMTGSPLGPSVRWVQIPFSSYGGMANEERGKPAFAKCFRLFLDERNYPIDFHCIAGADRTGSLACTLNGLLGVAEEELYRDWEVTGIVNPNMNFVHEPRFDKLIAVFDRFEGATLNERIEKYVLSCGITADEIARFRSLMLE